MAKSKKTSGAIPAGGLKRPAAGGKTAPAAGGGYHQGTGKTSGNK